MKFTRTRALVAALVPLAAVAAFVAPTASADTASAPKPTVTITPNYGAAVGGTATAKANVPCPDGSTSFRFMFSGPDLPATPFGSSRLGTPLPADGIPDTSAAGERPLFPASRPAVNGASYALDAECLDAARNVTKLATATVKVNEGVWTTLTPKVFALPTKIGSLRVSLVAFTGFAGGEGVTGALRAADGTTVPVTLQPQGTDAEGRGAALLQVPASVADGSYTLVVTGAASKATGEIPVTLDTTRVWW